MRRIQRSKQPNLNKYLMMQVHGGQLAVAEQWQQWGYDTQGMCTTCISSKDTAWHRATTCRRGKLLKHEAKNRRRVREWQTWQLEVTCSTGLRRFIAPNKPMEVPEHGEAITRAFIGDQEVPVENFEFVPTEPVAADGTAYNVRWGCLARAAWAAVQQVHGQLRWIAGTVAKTNGQNAVTAEHEGAKMAVEKGARRELLVDCAAVQKVATKSNEERCRHSKVHAGYWKRINVVERSLPCDRRPKWTKVQAHVTVPQQPVTEEDRRIVLNDKADTKCKEANLWHKVPEQEEDDWKRKAGRALSMLKDMAETLARYPKPREEEVEYKRAKKGRKLMVRSKAKHDWFWTAQGNWRCKNCWRSKWKETSEADYQPCGMITATMAKLGINAKHHALSAATVDNGPACIVFCSRCGGFAEYYAKKLACEQCTPPTANCRRNLDKIAAGKHPSRPAVLSEVWDLTGQHHNPSIAAYLQNKENAEHNRDLKQPQPVEEAQEAILQQTRFALPQFVEGTHSRPLKQAQAGRKQKESRRTGHRMSEATKARQLAVDQKAHRCTLDQGRSGSNVIR